MNRSEKEEMVSRIKENFSSANAVYLVDYHGVNVEEINGLRRQFLKENITYKVFKNTLVIKALEELGEYDQLNGLLEGMVGIAFAEENYVAPAKIIKKFNDDAKKLEFKGCYIDSSFYGSDQLTVLASMPTKEEVMASIVGSIAAPASGIVGTLNAVMRDLVSVIDEVGKTKAA